MQSIANAHSTTHHTVAVDLSVCCHSTPRRLQHPAMSLFSSSSSSAARKSAYNKSDDAGASREERMNRLKFELREHIRFLAGTMPRMRRWLA